MGTGRKRIAASVATLIAALAGAPMGYAQEAPETDLEAGASTETAGEAEEDAVPRTAPEAEAGPGLADGEPEEAPAEGESPAATEEAGDEDRDEPSMWSDLAGGEPPDPETARPSRDDEGEELPVADHRDGEDDGAEEQAPGVLRFGSIVLRPDFKLYADYQVDVGSDDLDNAFHITRAYLGMRLRVTDWLSARVTYDVSQASDLGAAGEAAVEDGWAEVEESRLQGSFLARLKYAYLDFDIEPLSLAVEVGVIHTPWIPWMEHIEDSRFLRKVMIEHEYHYPSADFGVALNGHIGSYVSYLVGVYNGEGYHGLEDARFKDLIGRISIRPMPNVRYFEALQISGYAQAELPPPEPDEGETHRRFGGALTYRLVEEVLSHDCEKVSGERFSTWIQAFAGQDGPTDDLVTSFGLSVGLRVELPARLFLIGRLDRFDPDLSTDDDLAWTVLAAFGIRPWRGMMVALDYQGRLVPGDDQHMIGIHTELHL